MNSAEITAHLTAEQKALIKEKERVDLLFKEQKYIIQSSEFFAFSLDAVLLADFVSLRRRRDLKILDFCTGGGIIPILLSHQTEAEIEGIEIQAELVDMAQRSVKLNNLENQVFIQQQDIREVKRASKHYDVITCNPPYFTTGESYQIREIDSHALARHEITLTLEEWVTKASSLLREKGKLAVVYRPSRLDDLIECLLAHQFSLHRLRFVHPKINQPANIVLVEAIYRGGRRGVKIESPVIVHTEEGDYTDQMKEVYFGSEN